MIEIQTLRKRGVDTLFVFIFAALTALALWLDSSRGWVAFAAFFLGVFVTRLERPKAGA